MAKQPTTARKATDTGTSTTVSRTTAETTSQPAGTATVRFSKEKYGGVVRGAVNGQRFEFPVDKDVQVTAAQIEALNNSGATFTTVSPLAGEGAGEGSSAPSILENTATRLFPAGQTDDAPKVDADGNPLATPELRQLTDKELVDGSQEASKEQAISSDETKALDAKAATAAEAAAKKN